ncbi:50S ribosomal protein L10 [Candidatus Daviesbacteria bacterium RIFCSPLOWO2_01_FULL_38_10]|nr:MAG: 50S ribosomal protein L10 [Candidatus Daviesbacteria bacterium RIFCSPHIGHO2_02_FULL_39_41]OGE38983.1 MAG: 50S ribosomal protein L10 [Candidatus Daviesbacteria bacterium RIFCSPLOWO2_01_FULL_38_10]OGE45469.1 MAG: 50S ribosomal protein L10 [Candidatus Daviesbacteria bacterium RIFCSPHIGHO2_12_FULL_38_25]OGE67555.1 MAG: 50S ribosomal protein L10 [Candidatus Daviesbacteria bacterium RIFCSPLOWO2_02_FULL_38_18]OGE72775.1 MAG: 50S ribosomal protein L10 [Candidatus Daviesbacteria bacterium RIFCSP
MPKTRVQKEEIVQKLKEKFSQARSVVFADYKGLSMKHLSDLRNKLSEVDSEFTITKNTLLNKANPEIKLEGPTATLFSYDDEISPIKLLVKALKDAALGKVKSGFLGQDLLDEAKILQLATLPSKDELRAKTVGILVAPIQGIVSVLQGNLRNLVYALNQIKLQRGGDAQASS